MSDTPVTSSELPARIGSVRVESRLGGGAMGEVFRGIDEELGRAVAVKLLAAPSDEEARLRFEREAVALARLAHPNVVTVYQKGTFGGRPYFTMELVDGPSVLQVLQTQGPFSVSEALEIARQAALGLHAAAEAGVTHRDVKPANLLVALDGTVKVADFGVCKIADANPGVTQDGTTLGTPFYMAPEQARGEKVDPRADQYALGATVFHLVTGKPPYGITQTVVQLLAHQKDPVPDIRTVDASIPEAIALLLQRMMAKNPADRFAGYSELLEAMDDAQLGPSRPRARGWLLASAVAAVASVVVGFAVLDPSPAPLPEPVAQPAPPPPPVAMEPAPPLEPVVVTPEPVVEDPPVVADVRGAELETRLESLLTEKGPARTASMRAVARTGGPRAREAMERIVVDDHDTDGPLAAVLLGEMGDQAATEALVKGLHSARRATVLASVDALSALRDVRAVEPLRELAQAHPDATVRTRAARAGSLLFTVEKGP